MKNEKYRVMKKTILAIALLAAFSLPLSNLQAQPDTNGDNTSNESRSTWRSRTVALNFAWGFHNWSTKWYNGFSGIDGDASVRTSFNHIQLSLNYPFVSTHSFALYLGLGLDWDKYKFTGNDITFNTATDPYTFADGGDNATTSWLNTRYVILPVTFRFDLWHDWNLSLAVIPGLHWGGSHTGLRRETVTDVEETTQYDQDVNKYINPYKLDLRATLSYDWFGLYLQVPTVSTMRASAQKLYPLKFGLFFTLD